MENEERRIYIHIRSNTHTGFLNQLNTYAEQGYKPVMDTYHVGGVEVDPTTGETYTIMEVILYDTTHNTLENEETLKRAGISQALLNAEFHHSEAQRTLQSLEDDLTLHTDWALASAETGNKITNKEQREAYIRTQTRKEREWVEETGQWLRHVKRLSVLHVEPGIAPWEVEDKQDEIASRVEIEKVNPSDDPDEDIVTPDMGMS